MMTDTRTNDETRQELAKLRQFAAQLAAHAVYLRDEEATRLASAIFDTTAGLVKQAEADGPLPPVLSSAGLTLPLHLLDTPANRRFVDTLEDAYAAGLAVDRERGYGEDGPAQILADLLVEARQECFGADGRGWE